jgi:hypothetical protein
MQHDEVHFGTDLALAAARSAAERVAAVPAGGAIDFVTYYFRDRRLAAELRPREAPRGGVRVTLTEDCARRTPTTR